MRLAIVLGPEFLWIIVTIAMFVLQMRDRFNGYAIRLCLG